MTKDGRKINEENNQKKSDRILSAIFTLSKKLRNPKHSDYGEDFL